MEKNYKNLGFVLIIFIPVTFFAFYHSYFGKFPDFDENIDFYIHLHAFFATIWLGLMIVQPLLIRNKRFELHKQFGKTSYFVFPFVVISLIPQIINIYSRGDDLLLTLSNITLLIFFYALAIANKRSMAKHMRYMIGLSLVFVQPTFGRILIRWFDVPFIAAIHATFLMVMLILLGLLLWDRANHRIYRPYLVVLACFIIYQFAFFISN